MSKFPILSSPIKVGSLTLRNRMITTSMSPGEGYVTSDGRPTQRHLNYLEERAAGGVALLAQTLAAYPREAGWGHPLVYAYREEDIPYLKQMADVVHKHGGLIYGQFQRPVWRRNLDEGEWAWGASAVAVDTRHEPFLEMSNEDIEKYKQDYIRFALTLQKAGWDAIEIMAGIGGVINRFISKATNKRMDEYGGSIENRCRLAVEIAQGIKKACGSDFTVTCRWSPLEYVPNCNTLEESLEVAVILEKAGVDLHNLAIGWHESTVPLTTKVIEDGHWAWVSERIKTVAKKPVATNYRETDPWIMEDILAKGKADVIGGVRYTIADPAFPKKVIEDRPEDIQRCVCCCRCIDDVVSRGKPLTHCSANARLGEELDGPLTPVKERRKVMVIGSGLSGLSAAFTAHKRGFEVTMYERGPRIGGCVVMSSVFNPIYSRIRDYYIKQLEKTPEIKVVFNRKVTAEFVLEQKPDVVIVAVGGSPKELDVPGADGGNVVCSHDFLEMMNGNPPEKHGFINKVMWNCGSLFLKYFYSPELVRKFLGFSWPLGKRIAVVGGGLPGCELVEQFIHRDREMCMIEEGKKIGFDVSPSERFLLTSGFKKAPNVRMEPLSKVIEVNKNGVKARRQDGSEFFYEADGVAITLGFNTNMKLAKEIEGKVPVLKVIGDCKVPARMADATKEGYLAVKDL